MEGIQNSLKQLGQLWNSFSPSQKGTYTVIIALLVAAPLIYSYKGSGSDYVPLLGGSLREEYQIRDVEDALINAGLNDFRRQGASILVPKGQKDEYAKALAGSDVISPEIEDIVSEGLQKIGMMDSPTETRELLGQLKMKKKAKEILKMEDVRFATVEWTPAPRRRGFATRSKLTGIVSVLMKGKRELRPNEVEAMATSVAYAVGGLDPQNVAVINLATGRSHMLKKDDPNELYFRVRSEQEATLQRQIENALTHIRGVVVTVNVELEKDERTRTRTVKFDPKAVALERSTKSQTETVRENERRAEPGNTANQPQQVRAAAAPRAERDSASDQSEQRSVTGGTESVGVTQGLRVVSSSATITIPRSYYEELLEQEGVTKPATDAPDEEKASYQNLILAKETEFKPKVTQAIAQFITAPTGVDPLTRVTIFSPPFLEPDPEEGPGIMEQASGAVQSYGRAVGLGLFALAALFLLNRSLKGTAPVPEPDIDAILNPPQPEEPTEPVREPDPPPPSRRDDVQFLVQDNPEMAAAVLNKWLS